MTSWWRASVLAAAGAATLLAGCGIRLAEAPSPGASLEPILPWPPPASPSASAAPVPMPSASALETTPTPVTPRDRALAEAARRVRAAVAVRSAVPAFDQLAAGMVARSDVPGAAVAVVAGDTVMYDRCFGLRRMGAPDAVDDGTLFQLGGVSRAYTTTLLAALAGDGEIGWDQPVRQVWPGFRLRDRWATREATFRDLTAGRSGLPAYAGTELRAFGYSRGEILRRLRSLRPAAGFRAVWAPQDALVVASAGAAERAAGAPWAQLLRTRVLDPIGAGGTLLGYRGFVHAADAATPHRLAGGTMVPQEPVDEDVFAPALGVSSSLSDLVTFARLQLNGGALAGERVAPAALVTQTLRPTTAIAESADGTLAAGPGWRFSTVDGRPVATAAGGLACGSSAVVSLLPDDGVAVVVLANAYPEGLALGRALTHTLVDFEALGAPQDDWLPAEQAAAADETAAPEAAGGWQEQSVGGAATRGVTLPARPPAAAAPPRARVVYTGVYEDRYYGRVTVSRGAGDGLNVRLGRGTTLRYVPWSGDVWRDAASGTAAVFGVRGGRARSVTVTLLTFDGRRGAFARLR
ncbi:MAG TPA: serine hydrolase [Thermoleophilia bacterium]|nr:serine hydrolase [Thermoleophilia bacterium]